MNKRLAPGDTLRNPCGTPPRVRRVIQLTFGNMLLYALCDDGTMWYLNEIDDGSERWERISKVPNTPMDP